MKKPVFVLVFFSLFLFNAQAQDLYGYYINEVKYEDAIHVKYELTLNEDSSFEFRFYQDQLCYVEDETVMGHWKFEGQIVLQSTKEESSVQARSIIKLKNTKLKTIGVSTLQIYNSETSWLNDLELKKKIDQ